jgi:hypothetical protein
MSYDPQRVVQSNGWVNAWRRDQASPVELFVGLRRSAGGRNSSRDL